MINNLKTNKSIIKSLIIIFSCLCITVCLSSCGTESESVKIGKYYLEGSETTYVEVLPKNKIELVGLDYSQDVEIYENLGLTIDFAANLQGIKNYEFDSENMKIVIPLFDESIETQISIKFTYSNNRLTRRNQNYILDIEKN